MIRLAIVRQKYNPNGGAERFVSRVLESLSARGALSVTVLARQWQPGPWQSETLAVPHLGRLWRDWAFARAAQRRFADFDLVQSHERIPGAPLVRVGDGVHAVWLAQLARSRGPLGRLLLAASPYHRYVCAAEAAMFRHPALRKVICNSQLVREQVARGFGVPADKLALIYNGVDTERFHPRLADQAASLRAQWHIPPQAPVLAFVGSGFERKGLAQALAVLAAHPALYLLVAGQDKAARRYQAQAQRLGVAARLRLLGGVADITTVYGAADALILPTLYDPFPNACLEALACGLPVLTTTQCGAAEWLREGENGWVRDALDTAGLIAAAGAWLACRGDWPQLRAAARATAAPHTLARMSSELEALYAELLTGRG